MGGKNLLRAISQVGLMAGERFEEFSARARELVAAGMGNDLMQVPGWWWIISAQTFVDYLDHCPDILELAPQVRCPVLFLRGDGEAKHVYPGEVHISHLLDKMPGQCDDGRVYRIAGPGPIARLQRRRLPLVLGIVGDAEPVGTSGWSAHMRCHWSV